MPALCFLSERSRVRFSFSVRSGSLETRSSSHCLWLSSGERLWPVPGLASTLPVVVQRSIQRIAVEAPILRSRAASRALSPDSTIANTRTLGSLEYPFAIAGPRFCHREHTNLICEPKGIPCNSSDSRQAESALAKEGIQSLGVGKDLYPGTGI